MGSMQELTQQQEQNGKALQKVIDNYKKDPPQRKSLEYYKERLQRLNAAWEVFEATDSKIRALDDVSLDHPYFANEYYDSIMTIHQKYQQHFMDKIASIVQEESIQKDRPKDSKADASKSRTKDDPKFTSVNSKSTSISKTCTEVPNQVQEKDVLKPGQTNVTALIRKEKSQMAALEHHLRTIENKTAETHPEAYYELKLKLVNDYWTYIFNTHRRILEFIESAEELDYNDQDYLEMENWVQDILEDLSSRLQVSAPSTPATSGRPQIKLPKITLPQFQGDYLAWNQFKELYTQLIHNQPISDAEKMFYLISNLTGEAKALIQHIPVSGENYNSAWELLQKRYNNKRLLVSALLDKLLEQPNIQHDSAASIKALHDTTKECLMGLRNMGLEVSKWDPILIHLIIKKFDRATHNLYEQGLNAPRELQTLEELLEFLELRFQALEALGKASGRPSGNRLMRRNGPISNSFVTTARRGCLMCPNHHPLFFCKKFLELTPLDRLKLLRKNNLCINCMRSGHKPSMCTLRGCSKCQRKHNTLLHLPEKAETGTHLTNGNRMTIHTSGDSQSKNSGQATPGPSTALAASTNNNFNKRQYVLLGTAIVDIIDVEGNAIECRAILDSGSQISIISEKLRNKLALRQAAVSIDICGVGGNKQKAQKCVSIRLKSKTTGFSTRINAVVLPTITSSQPSCLIDISHWNIPKNVRLADPNFNQPHQVDLLIGAEVFYELLSVGQINLGANLPRLQNTTLGWIVSGAVHETYQEALPHNLICGITTQEEASLEEQISKFWRLEEVEASLPRMTAEEVKCETNFNQTVKRSTSGRFIVHLPFLHSPDNLGQSRDIALRRFFALERKLARNTDIKTQYIDFMEEYARLGHMKMISWSELPSSHYFLPHHCVLKPDSTTTKLRVVFDASAKSSSNISLNDILGTGPTIQDDLFAILLRFRLPRYVFTADIEKMYRQILVDEDDRKYQLIVWREDPSQSIKCYQLCTVTYGTTSAPYLATKCLQRLASQGAEKYPLGAKALSRDFYVDDVMTGADSLSETLEIQKQLSDLLRTAGFNLRKWCANHERLLENVPTKDQAMQLELSDNCEQHTKTLGLTWIPTADKFIIRTTNPREQRLTKRTVLSDIAQLFDPLGIMGPVTVTAKMFLQELWKLKLDWDAALPMNLHTTWTKYREGLASMADIKFARHIFGGKRPQSIQIHAFSDASEKAYGAAIYLRAAHTDGTITMNLLCAKSRVAPTKTITLPRLELCAAKLAAELMHRVKGDLNMHDQECFFWTDSEIVLAWLNSESSSFHTFVANRIAAIQQLTNTHLWRHVRSKENPADLVLRGVPPEKFPNCQQEIQQENH